MLRDEEEEQGDRIPSPQLFEQDSPSPVPKKKRERSPPTESPKEKPVIQPVVNKTEIGFLVRFVLYGALIFSGLFFYGTLSVALHHNASLPSAFAHLMAWRLLDTRHHHTQGYVYPLRTQQHDTTSIAFDVHAHYAMPLASTLHASFAHHLQSGVYSCLCMHHLRVPSDQQYALCAVGTHADLMANPRIIGTSNETARMTETSLSCTEGSVRVRHLSVVVAWQCPRTRQHLHARYEGTTAVCLQIALDELKGKEHCH